MNALTYPQAAAVAPVVNAQPLTPATERDRVRAAMEAAAGKLAANETGQAAARLLHRFLKGAGGSLDATNQSAVMVLLAGAFGPFGGTVPDLPAVAAAGARIVKLDVPDSDL